MHAKERKRKKEKRGGKVMIMYISTSICGADPGGLDIQQCHNATK
jgi:hypothetical protein